LMANDQHGKAGVTGRVCTHRTEQPGPNASPINLP
jgi:hypothetical protein